MTSEQPTLQPYLAPGEVPTGLWYSPECKHNDTPLARSFSREAQKDFKRLKPETQQCIVDGVRKFIGEGRQPFVISISH